MIDFLYTAAKTALAIFALSLIIPLMVWGGSGSFRQAMEALKEYWIIMGGLVAVAGAAAVWAMLMHWIG